MLPNDHSQHIHYHRQQIGMNFCPQTQTPAKISLSWRKKNLPERWRSPEMCQKSHKKTSNQESIFKKIQNLPTLLPIQNSFSAWTKQTVVYCLRPYHLEYTSSRPITEVKQGWAVLVLGWVTANFCCLC